MANDLYVGGNAPMGFAINYRSTRPVKGEEAEAISKAASDAARGRTWLGCEPVHFTVDEDGHLRGSSKPNFDPDPDDVVAATSEGLPDGTVPDMLDVLCRLGREYRMDWEISHDESDGPVGWIRAGECDPQVLARLDAFVRLSQELRNLTEDG